MTQPQLIGLILLAAGGFNLRQVYKFRFDEAWARDYIKRRPKALLLRKVFGEEKAYRITRDFLAPLGFVLSVGMIGLGMAFLGGVF